MRSIPLAALARAAGKTLALLAGAAACAAQAADTGSLVVSAVVLSKSNCRFSGTSSATLNFNSISPAATADAVATSSLVIRCGGSAANATFAIAAGDGLFAAGAGAPRMRHAATVTEFLPYTISLTPASATIPKNTDQTITITGRITPTQVAGAIAGSFSDLVAITLAP
jgi:hypothetical protein